MKLSELGEFQLIERIRKVLPGIDKANPVELGIGDDCAVIDPRTYTRLVLTTDTMVEEVHFSRRFASAADIGFKALAVNLSDVAAMGAEPRDALLSLNLPDETEVEWVLELVTSFGELARAHGVKVVGGNTSGSPQGVSIGVTLLGNTSAPVLRSQAQPGDFVCITKSVGDSGLGLLALQAGQGAKHAELVRRHLRPEPEVQSGLWLAREKSVHAMIDSSDGLAADLTHMVMASGLSIDIELEKVPISSSAREYLYQAQNLSALDLLAMGEDYALVFTAGADLTSRFSQSFSRPLYVIGQVAKTRESHPALRILSQGQELQAKRRGHDHFKKP